MLAGLKWALVGATVKFVNEVLRIGEVGDLELQTLVRGTVEGRAKVCGPSSAKRVRDKVGLLLRHYLGSLKNRIILSKFCSCCGVYILSEFSHC